MPPRLLSLGLPQGCGDGESVVGHAHAAAVDGTVLEVGFADERDSQGSGTNSLRERKKKNQTRIEAEGSEFLKIRNGFEGTLTGRALPSLKPTVVSNDIGLWLREAHLCCGALM